MKVGFSFSLKAEQRASLNEFILLCMFSTVIVFQPRALNRVDISSENAKVVGPSMVLWLSSYISVSLLSFQWAAKDAASWDMPSMAQPSPMTQYLHWQINRFSKTTYDAISNFLSKSKGTSFYTYVRWSTRIASGLLNLAAKWASAKARPTALATPCPRGPIIKNSY